MGTCNPWSGLRSCPRCGAVLVVIVYYGKDVDYELCKVCGAVLRMTLAVHGQDRLTGTTPCL